MILRSLLLLAALLVTAAPTQVPFYVTGCDGSTDVTAALRSMADTIGQSGGTMLFPPRGNCVINGQGQALAPLANWSSVSYVKVVGNGATIVDEHPYQPGDYGPIINGDDLSSITIDGLNLTQANPVTIGSHVPYGAVLFACGRGCSKVELRNLTVSGAESPILYFDSVQLSMVDVTSAYSLYGMVAGGAGDGGETTDVFARNLVCMFCDRSLFLRGVRHADIAMKSISPQVNDVLITCTNANGYNSDIKLQYDSPAADASLVSYITIGNSGAWNTATGCVYDDIEVNVNISEWGVQANVPVLKLIKSTTAALGDYYMNIRLSGTVFPVNSPGEVVDLFSREDAPWGGEHAYNVVAGPLMIAGGLGSTFHVDMSPFSLLGDPALKLDMVNGLSTAFVAENVNGRPIINIGSKFASGL